MKIINAKFIIFFGIIVLGAVYFWPVEKGPNCYQTSDEQVQTFVKNDFLQRMKRWDDDAKLLGTRTPEITWEKIERTPPENKIKQDILLLPFKAKGPNSTKRYFGMYQCEKGYVEYASE